MDDLRKTVCFVFLHVKQKSDMSNKKLITHKIKIQQTSLFLIMTVYESFKIFFMTHPLKSISNKKQLFLYVT